MVRVTGASLNIKKLMSLLRPQADNYFEKIVRAAAKSPYPAAQNPPKREIPKSLQKYQNRNDGVSQPQQPQQQQQNQQNQQNQQSQHYQQPQACNNSYNACSQQLQNLSKPRSFTHGCGTPNSVSQAHSFNRPSSASPLASSACSASSAVSQFTMDANVSSCAKYGYGGGGGAGRGGSTANPNNFNPPSPNNNGNHSNTYVSNYRADVAEKAAAGGKMTTQTSPSYASSKFDYEVMSGSNKTSNTINSNYNMGQMLQLQQQQQQQNNQSQIAKRPDREVIAKLREIYRNDLESIANEGHLKAERIITAAQNPRITFKGNQLRILNFCSNNYLGFSSHPAVMKHSRNILVQYGSGLSSVRHVCGTQDIHKDLEKLLTKFHEREDAVLYNSCFDANLGIFDALLTSNDAVFMDENSHASLMQGLRLSQAKQHFYKHSDMLDLENQLGGSNARIKMIATDGVFAMDGDAAPLPHMLELADKHGAIVMLDDSHATGILGTNGRGSEEHWDCMGRVDIINSSLSKALSGAAGGYTVGPAELIAMLRQRSQPYLYSNSLSPPVIAAASMSLQLLMESNALIQKLQENTEQFRNGMHESGFQLLGDKHPLCPIIVGDTNLTNTFADKIQWRGVYVMPITYPLVAKDKPRIRVQISAAHSSDEIKRAIEAFVFIGKMLKVTI